MNTEFLDSGRTNIFSSKILNILKSISPLTISHVENELFLNIPITLFFLAFKLYILEHLSKYA